ncbi:hypothetical protein AOA01_00320 [Listeria monocytogenes]|uniref:hypothetical protein n=1 Tax=Listeria monocytogenes TaxID=1639 RepID=UPI0007757546|nr:hypothetical protein [Listeria monocytogenes]EAF5877623.1 hypothetical protein [Listeria monocytogenes]EKZ4877801.1 hypothetical protein [Listeria monocytogenes]KXS65751.1 hypothetical protein AWJ02_01470 [Listeria monocytogenes]KXW92906.1 hypothetical protein AWJ00_08225 [Listeria monocytogenes]
MNKDIILGAGEVFMLDFTGDKIPTHSEIETEKNNVGHTSGGASFEYKPETYDVVNSYGQTVKRLITKEECVFKTGILSWSLDKIKLLTPAKIEEKEGERRLVFGGAQKLTNVLVRFVHTKDSGKKIRLTMVANAGNGFTMDFKGDQETIVDAELTAISYIDKFLASIDEEIDNVPVEGGGE